MVISLILAIAAAFGLHLYSIFRGSSGRFVFCTQDILEPILLEKATSLGVRALFNTELVSVEQNEDGVTATLLDRLTRKKSLLRCDYLIAADGARSPMREMLKIPFDGPPPLSRQLNMYFRSDLSHLTKKGPFSLCSIRQPTFRGLIATINATDLWTLHVVVKKDSTPEDFPEEKCLEYIRAAVGIPNLKVELKGFSTWDSQVRVARTYNDGRIYFAGDSAHSMPPWGGFGANTGIQDAHNLCWKLSAVIKKEAGEKLLASYQPERQPIAHAVTQIAGSMNDENGLMHTAWFSLAPKMFRALPYFCVGYGYSSAVILESTFPLPGPGTTELSGKPGTRVPHVSLRFKDDTTKSTIDLCTSLTLFCGPDTMHTPEIARKVSEELNIALNVFRGGVDGDGDFVKSFGIGRDGILLARPDAFVAWRMTSEASLTKEMFREVLTKLYAR